MLELTVNRTSKQVLAECAKRGLIVKLDAPNKKPPGRHWHLGYRGKPGVLEMTDAGGVVSLKVADNRDGGWAAALARELAKGRS